MVSALRRNRTSASAKLTVASITTGSRPISLEDGLQHAEVKAFGIPWYRPEDYGRIVALMIDSNKMPSSYDLWLMSAEQVEGQMKAAGFTIHRATIDPDEFPLWCAARGLGVDARGRTAFANAFAQEQISRA